MSKYPLCERAGLKIIKDERHVGSGFFSHTLTDFVIKASEVEEMLEKATVVYKDYCSPQRYEPWTLVDKTATHKGRVVMIEDILEEPLKQEFILESHQNLDYSLKKFAGKRVKVTVEEIRD